MNLRPSNRRPHPATPALACALLAVALAAGCTRAPQQPAEIDPSATMNPADIAQVTASYLCDGGPRIDIVRGLSARLYFAGDGRVVKIEPIEGSVPPTFVDHGLTLTLPPGRPALLEDDDGNARSCNPTALPHVSPPAPVATQPAM